MGILTDNINNVIFAGLQNHIQYIDFSNKNIKSYINTHFTGINEVTTEYIARKIMGEYYPGNYITDANSVYGGYGKALNTFDLFIKEGLIDEETLLSAYFGNNIFAIVEKLSNSLGLSYESINTILELFDQAIEKETRDNAVVFLEQIFQDYKLGILTDETVAKYKTNIVNENNTDNPNEIRNNISLGKARENFREEDTYNGYNRVLKVDSGNINQFRNAVNEVLANNNGENILIEVQSTSDIDFDLIKSLPDNVSVRVDGAYKDAYLRRYNSTDEAIKMREKVTYTKDELLAIKNEFDKIEFGIEPNWSEREKALYIYEYLKKNMSYFASEAYENKGNQNRGRNWDSLIGLVDHVSTCNGFAFIYQELLKRQGIDCYSVSGQYGGHGSHAWSIAVIDGKSMFVDIIWDAQEYAKGNNQTTGFGFNIEDNGHYSNYKMYINELYENGLLNGNVENITEESLKSNLDVVSRNIISEELTPEEYRLRDLDRLINTKDNNIPQNLIDEYNELKEKSKTSVTTPFEKSILVPNEIADATGILFNINELLDIITNPDIYQKFIDFENNIELFQTGSKTKYIEAIRQLKEVLDNNSYDIELSEEDISRLNSILNSSTLDIENNYSLDDVDFDISSLSIKDGEIIQFINNNYEYLLSLGISSEWLNYWTEALSKAYAVDIDSYSFYRTIFEAIILIKNDFKFVESEHYNKLLSVLTDENVIKYAKTVDIEIEDILYNILSQIDNNRDLLPKKGKATAEQINNVYNNYNKLLSDFPDLVKIIEKENKGKKVNIPENLKNAYTLLKRYQSILTSGKIDVSINSEIYVSRLLEDGTWSTAESCDVKEILSVIENVDKFRELLSNNPDALKYPPVIYANGILELIKHAESIGYDLEFTQIELERINEIITKYADKNTLNEEALIIKQQEYDALLKNKRLAAIINKVETGQNVIVPNNILSDYYQAIKLKSELDNKVGQLTNYEINMLNDQLINKLMNVEELSAEQVQLSEDAKALKREEYYRILDLNPIINEYLNNQTSELLDEETATLIARVKVLEQEINSGIGIITEQENHILENAYNNQKANIELKEKILASIKGLTDPIQIARKLYLELAKVVTYDYGYFEIDNETKEGRTLKDLLFSKDVAFYNLNDSRSIICKGWSQLYRELLLEAGFSKDQVTIIGEGEGRRHNWIEINIGDHIIVADATEPITPGAIDLVNVKGGLSTGGFVYLPSSLSGIRLYSKDGTTGYVSLSDSIKQNSDNMLQLVDNALGIVNLDQVYNKANVIFDDDYANNIYSFNTSKGVVEVMKDIVNLGIPTNMSPVEVSLYFNKLLKNVFLKDGQNVHGLARYNIIKTEIGSKQICTINLEQMNGMEFKTEYFVYDGENSYIFDENSYNIFMEEWRNG